MALSDLLQAIEDDAAAERVVADRETTTAAAAIIERARNEAAALEVHLASAPEAQARAEADRRLALARLDAARGLRAAREKAFLAVRTDLCEQLAELRTSGGYPAVFGALLAESRAALPSGSQLRVDPRDSDLATSLAGGLQVVATLETWGGVELADEDGRTIRNTLEERLANADPLLRGRFAAWLASDQERDAGGPP
jgi:V/A-type H+/Na+-transporting ATPase subunit E